MISFAVLAVLLGGIGAVLYIGKKNNQADWGHWLTNILDGLIRVYCRRYHRQNDQKIKIPQSGPVILASNHISGIDPFIIITATNRPIRFMIAQEEYQKPILNWMFRAAGCIPVDRAGRVEKAFRSVIRAIQAGEVVAIFPQGGIHHTTTPREKIKPGIIKLSLLTLTPIIPIRIWGIVAPGTITQAAIQRSQVEFETHCAISADQVAHPDFAGEMSQWLIFSTHQIRLD
ncbi:lysophospholipid acyltransferase family protein [Aliikangiella maris]|uniref:Lysophospholipid acyltransferase family protein n=2 Tax=Aliikangiella maris TaxID=3162458 RepID=A0ABV3MLD0_9GAMM